MNCEHAQEAILLSDSPAAILLAADSELGRHVAECAVCQAFVQRLARVEMMTARLGLPANSEAARAAVLANVRQRVQTPERRLLLRPVWISAVAAVLVVGIGVGIWIQKSYLTPAPQQVAKGPAVMDQLLDWDLALADAEAPQERQALYTAQAATLQTAVQAASLNDEDRRFATTLLENGAWLSRNHDPVERTEKFCDLADLLVGRMDKAAAANDEQTVQRLGKHYGRVQKGIGANLARINANAFVAPTGPGAKRAERLERIAKRQEEAERRLAVLAEKSPVKAQKALKRMLEKRAERRGGAAAGAGENVR
jgi:hypothetical protein